MTTYSPSRVLESIYSSVWAIRHEALRDIIDRVQTLAPPQGPSSDEEPLLQKSTPMDFGVIAGRGDRGSAAVAVVPVHGILSQRPTLFTMLFGGVTTEAIGAALRGLRADPNIKAIVLDIDSPGGSVFGVPELAEEIRAMRGEKPIVAVANPLAASAAYWLASQTDEVAVTPSGITGSIGIFTIHFDQSRMMDRMGLTPTLVSAGKFKTEGNSLEPLSDAARERLQAEVDTYYDLFINAVAAGRNVSPRVVRSGFGEGRVALADEAVRLGLADRVATLDEVLSGLGIGGAPSQGERGRRRAQLGREVERAALD